MSEGVFSHVIYKIGSLNSRIRDIEDEIKKLNEEFPSLKQAITEWQEYQKKKEEECYGDR